jgi:hypothetical protein
MDTKTTTTATNPPPKAPVPLTRRRRHVLELGLRAAQLHLAQIQASRVDAARTLQRMLNAGMARILADPTLDSDQIRIQTAHLRARIVSQCDVADAEHDAAVARIVGEIHELSALLAAPASVPTAGEVDMLAVAASFGGVG